MELHLVDAVPVPVVGVQHGRVLVGQPPVVLRLSGPGEAAQGVQLLGGPVRAFAPQPVQQRGIIGQIMVDQRGNLVEHLVRHVPHGT